MEEGRGDHLEAGGGVGDAPGHLPLALLPLSSLLRAPPGPLPGRAEGLGWTGRDPKKLRKKQIE